MDIILCDELLQEIFHRLPPPSSSAISLVCKRWLRLIRSYVTSLSLHFPTRNPTLILSLSSFLSHHTYLSSLSLTTVFAFANSSSFSDPILLAVASSCPNLRELRFLTGPVSLFPLLSLSSSCTHLSSVTIILSRPLSFHWLISFLSLRDLSLICTSVSEEFDSFEPNSFENVAAELQLENLCLSGIRAGDYGLSWLWRSCKTLKKLRFRSCEGVGDNASFSYFLKVSKNLREVELRTCRTIVDGVLLKLAQNCNFLISLLIYDGGSKEGLLEFIRESRCNLQNLDLRLPLDLDDNHLFAIAANFKGLSTLRLRSCVLVTGEGLKTLGVSVSNNLEELSLINCDVIHRENGLLTTLGQNLRNLRKLDLSHNDMLLDKEFISMMISCNDLRELKLRGCGKLSNASLISLFKNCKHLEIIDVMHCFGIKAEAVEFIVLNSPQLRKLQVEEFKLSDVARRWTASKFIEVVFD